MSGRRGERRGERRGGGTDIHCRHHEGENRQTPSFIIKLQKTIEVRRGGGGGGGGHNKYLGRLESGYGEDAWFVRGGQEGPVLQCERLGQSHLLLLQ